MRCSRRVGCALKRKKPNNPDGLLGFSPHAGESLGSGDETRALALRARGPAPFRARLLVAGRLTPRSVARAARGETCDGPIDDFPPGEPRRVCEASKALHGGRGQHVGHGLSADRKGLRARPAHLLTSMARVEPQLQLRNSSVSSSSELVPTYARHFHA